MTTEAARAPIHVGRIAARVFLALWDVTLVLLLFLPAAIGFVGGFITRVAVYSWAALIDGFRKGRYGQWPDS